ncbi:MAG: rhomboid family intramembrane serine protease [Tyzzerella sp.]|nr:rhomboid family intramembrane serine protease [Tyzzerella sp.]
MGNRRTPLCTIALVIINVAVFLILSFGGMTENALYMAEHGAMYVPYFLYNKEYYRIVTCMFLHFGFEHLMNNMVTLVIVGRYLEPLIGKVRFIIIYLISGLGGSALSLVAEYYTGDYAVSAGASGAIFGLTGALLSLAILNRGRIAELTKRGIVIMIALSLYNGFVTEGVDNLAHVGGLICGFLVTFVLCFQRYAKRRANTFR